MGPDSVRGDTWGDPRYLRASHKSVPLTLVALFSYTTYVIWVCVLEFLWMMYRSNMIVCFLISRVRNVRKI